MFRQIFKATSKLLNKKEDEYLRVMSKLHANNLLPGDIENIEKSAPKPVHMSDYSLKPKKYIRYVFIYQPSTGCWCSYEEIISEDQQT